MNTFYEALKKQDPFFLGFPSKVKTEGETWKRIGAPLKRSFCKIMRMEVPAAMYVPDHFRDDQIVMGGNAYFDNYFMIFNNGDIVRFNSNGFFNAVFELKDHFRREARENER